MGKKELREEYVQTYVDLTIQNMVERVSRLKAIDDYGKKLTPEEGREAFRRVIDWIQRSDSLSEDEKFELVSIITADTDLMKEGKPDTSHYIR